ncbi:MAG: hypothetical protein RL397_1399 [Pseudomonadota bacterium]
MGGKAGSGNSQPPPSTNKSSARCNPNAAIRSRYGFLSRTFVIHSDPMEMPTDPFAFLKAAWPGFQSSAAGGGLASSGLPTTDLDEIDRRIADLKTVEQWLSLNLNILKTTIQGLEIQRGTIAAVQSWQASMADFGKPSAQASTGPEPSAGAAAEAMPPPAAQWWWSSMQDQFNQLVQTAQAMQSSGASETGEPLQKRRAGGSTGKSRPPRKPKAAAAKKPGASRA